jgi:hypothetical protein
MAAFLAALSLPAAASEDEDYMLETAGDLADLCDEPENASAIHMCQGFLVGVHQMHGVITEALGVTVYCIPTDTGITRNSVAADFSAWVKAHPDMAGLPAREGLLTWAHQTYPCK